MERHSNKKSAKSSDFFQDNNAIKKKRKPYLKPYSTMRIKTRNYLSNISCTGINKEDFHNKNFVFDVHMLLTKNLNPFLLDQKLSNQNKHKMIYMLWKECIPSDFYKFICREEHFLCLDGKNVLYAKNCGNCMEIYS